MTYWVVVVRDYYGDTDVSGEWNDELHAQVFRNGYAAAYHQFGGSGSVLVVARTD